MLEQQRLGAFFDGTPRDVDGQVDESVLLVEERLDQETCLLRTAAPQFDEGRVRIKVSGDLGSTFPQDLPFDACEVVLFEFADFLKDFRTEIVVEKSAGKGGRGGRESGADFFRERGELDR